ncbi:GRAM domain-containing protein 2B [Protopterus annectens]|uniref:GRAM domain-containing protein 2B n=1 Tax=Protopterus annectens TaxID=7888 RepID=UPI001CFBB542|nr:GRAM domain-containing protein 2B [Protopterus annectens]
MTEQQEHAHHAPHYKHSQLAVPLEDVKPVRTASSRKENKVITFISDIENGLEEKQRKPTKQFSAQLLSLNIDQEFFDGRRVSPITRSKTFDSSFSPADDFEVKLERKKSSTSQYSKANAQFHKLFHEVAAEELLKQSFTFVPNKPANLAHTLIDLKQYVRKLNLNIMFQNVEQIRDLLRISSTYNPPIHPLLAMFEKTVEMLPPCCPFYRNMLPGTVIVSDEWAAYKRIEAIPGMHYKHLCVNHSQNFVNPMMGAHTNAVEGMWANCKRHFKGMNGTRPHVVPSYLDEFMWRSRYGNDFDTLFVNLLNHIHEFQEAVLSKASANDTEEESAVPPAPKRESHSDSDKRTIMLHSKNPDDICFHGFVSLLIMKDTKILIPVTSVILIKKTKAALLVPNAVVIATETEKYLFVSLLSRDGTYKLLKSVCSHLDAKSLGTSPNPPSLESSFGPERPTSLPLDTVDFLNLDGVVRHRRQQMEESSSSGSRTPESENYQEPHNDERHFLKSTKNEQITASADIHIKQSPERRSTLGNDGYLKTQTGLLHKVKSSHLLSVNGLLLFYAFLVCALIFSTFYMGIKILALEQRLTSMSSLADFHSSTE